MIFSLCFVTQVMKWSDVTNHWWYCGLWSTGLIAWGFIFWACGTGAGRLLFVERQIAHAWAAGTAASIGLFLIEVVQGLPALTLSPVLCVAGGMVFLFKAGTLSGQFYVYAVIQSWRRGDGVLDRHQRADLRRGERGVFLRAGVEYYHACAPVSDASQKRPDASPKRR